MSRNPQLPELAIDGGHAARLADRAVRTTLLVFASLLILAIIASFSVEVSVTIKAKGRVEPSSVALLRAEVSGIVREVLVGTGDSIAAGKLVARLDALDAERSSRRLLAEHRVLQMRRALALQMAPVELRRISDLAAQARARRSEARASLRQRMVDYGLGNDLDSLLTHFREGSHIGIDLAVGELLSAEAEIRRVESDSVLVALKSLENETLNAEIVDLEDQIRVAERRIAQAEIRSPVSGVVLTDSLRDLVGGSVREGSTLVEIARHDGWRAVLEVSERDIQFVRLGDRVRLELQALDRSSRKRLNGLVVNIASRPMSALTAGVYRVDVDIDDAAAQRLGPGGLRSGLSVQGSILTRSGKIFALTWDYVRRTLAPS